MRLCMRDKFVVLSVFGLVAIGATTVLIRYQSLLWFGLLGTDLSEFFVRPLFTIGKLAVSPSFLLKSSLFLVALTLGSRWSEKALRIRVLSHTALDPEHSYSVARLFSIAVFVLGLVIGVDTAGVDLRSLALLGSALVGVGLGLQPIITNFVAGLVLLMERPVKLGDRIDLVFTCISQSKVA
ncbi:MAG: mechanosensitive ion channel protein [Bryobacterales bacterium]|nr:mechanosensitive ion channel protein [Bryobacterales bacterium]